MNVIDGLRDVNLSGRGVVGNFDGKEGDVAVELVDHFECFLNIGLV